MSDSGVRNVVIVGGGPAGLTAAIYSARALLDPIVIEGELGPGGEQPGGQLMLTTEVENFPGFPEGVMGPELIELFRNQAERFGAEFVDGKADALDLSARPYTVRVGDREILTRSIIVATGASARTLGVPGEQEFFGMGVSTCATCDGAFFRDRELIVVGGGDSAMEEALFLTRFASRVTVVHRRSELRASRIMQERAMKNEKVEFIWNSEVAEVLGDQKVTGVRLRDTQTGEESKRDVDGVFVAIGHRPNTDFVKGQLDLDAAGYLVTHDKTRTNVEGVFAAGDALDHVYRQAITAAGLGCMAAIDTERWLDAAEHGGEVPW